jgi:hypothetical protein
MKKSFAALCVLSMACAFAQDAKTPRFTSADAKNHVGEVVTVCGKVADSKVLRYGLPGHGKPVNFDLDQPQPNAVFYFTTFGTQDGGPQEAVTAYDGKKVCVTGKIDKVPGSDTPFIMAADRSKIKVEEDAK